MADSTNSKPDSGFSCLSSSQQTNESDPSCVSSDSKAPATTSLEDAAKPHEPPSSEQSKETLKEKEEKEDQEQPKKLPKLTASEFRAFNRLSTHMDLYHESFRQTHSTLLQACKTNKRPQGMSIRQFLSTGLSFCHHLTMHHSIEEQHIFPVLAQRMPAFRKELQLLEQHKKIHEGIEEMENYLEECRAGEKELRLAELGEIMEGFSKVLWEHLDAEVKELGAENMRKYWSIEEVKALPF